MGEADNKFNTISLIEIGIVIREMYRADTLPLPLFRGLCQHAYITLGTPHLGMPNKRTWINGQIGIRMDAITLYDEMTIDNSNYPPLDDLPFTIKALISVQGDTVVPIDSSQACRQTKVSTDIFRHVIKSGNYIDWILWKYAHSYAFHRPRVILQLKRLLEQTTSDGFVWED